jgi:hypothetical protein
MTLRHNPPLSRCPRLAGVIVGGMPESARRRLLVGAGGRVVHLRSGLRCHRVRSIRVTVESRPLVRRIPSLLLSIPRSSGARWRTAMIYAGRWRLVWVRASLLLLLLRELRVLLRMLPPRRYSLPRVVAIRRPAGVHCSSSLGRVLRVAVVSLVLPRGRLPLHLAVLRRHGRCPALIVHGRRYRARGHRLRPARWGGRAEDVGKCSIPLVISTAAPIRITPSLALRRCPGVVVIVGHSRGLGAASSQWSGAGFVTRKFGEGSL